jgi:hypothetical protein
MKKLSIKNRKALRLAASASLALVAIVSSAHARQTPVVQVSESITLRSGNNAAGVPLSSGNNDGNITHVIVAGCTPDPFHDYNDALAGSPAKAIDSASFWVPSIGDPDARWIHSDHNPHGAAGSGFPTGSVQYAHPFVLPADMPDNAKVEFELEFAADNFVGAVGFSDLSSIPVTSATLLSGFPTGNFSSITNVSLSGPASSFGLSAGQNSLFFRVCETDERASGLIYSVTLTVDYCKIELDLRSGFGEIPDNTPVDVVLLADTTSSMGPQITQIQADATVILSTLTNTYPNIQIGVADYRDFPGVAFQLGQPITSNQSAINAAIMSWFPAGGGDIPEGQLYALDRLVKDPTVGWRAGSVRVIVYFGDAPGHDPICPAINPFNYLITETSVIDDLKNFGDWGTNVIAVSSGNNLNSPFTSDTSYTSTCGSSSGVAGQADRITAATDGVVQTIGSSTQITATILSAIDTVLSGAKPLPYGSLDPNVVHEPLSNSSAFSVLASNMGHAAVVVRPNSSWITSLPGGSAAWIHSSHSGGASVDGTGRPPESVLYAHRFQLPNNTPLNATVFLDLEWAASDSLYGVSINGDVLSAGGNVGIGGGTADEFAFPSTGNFSGPASSLSVGPGTNRLYLSQFERTPTANTGNDECSGIMYIAKLTITFQCDTEVTYDTFCECVSDWGPCNNPGAPGQGCANSTGVGARLTASGPDHASTILHVDNLPAVIGTIGLFFGSTSQISPLVFGDGLRCVGQPMRYGVTYTYTGHTDLFIGVTNPGECYQYWYRDNSGPCGSGFNLTNAIEIH